MLTASRYMYRTAFRPGVSARSFHTSRDLIVTQAPDSTDCTRASIATIINHLKQQKVVDVDLVDTFLRKTCEDFRSRNIDGLQPHLETKAAIELFKQYGLRTQSVNLNSSKLSNRVELGKLMHPLSSGFILASSQPPGNPSHLGHSIVITDVFWNHLANELNVGVFDPYPMRDRDINGRRILSIHDIKTVDLKALVYVGPYEPSF